VILIPRLSMLRPHGALLDDGREVADLLQCCHCQYTWRLEPGSGRRRGFCTLCMGVTCGRPPCMECSPFKAASGE
jgi:hypothetical protein